jgi:mono/diheme cytochrome c family protein
MKKIGKVLIYVFLLVFVLLGAGMSYVKFALPNVGDAPELKVDVTTQRVERGKYLANHVSPCIDCHSQRDWSKFAGPPVASTIGMGGEKFDESIGFPGSVHSANITPFNLKGWTDGELYRLITTGVKKDGSALINIMPYPAYGRMAQEDIYSIIAYLRTLPAKESTTPERRLDFPLNFIVNTIPSAAAPQPLPAESDTLRYGGYLVNAAGCIECHTKHDKGSLVKGMEFAGGREFAGPGGSVFSSNITSDEATGIGTWTKEQFITKFKQYGEGYTPHQVKPGEFQTIMPWVMYAQMKESDLSAIYTYIHSIKPISNQVTRFVATPQVTKN